MTRSFTFYENQAHEIIQSLLKEMTVKQAAAHLDNAILRVFDAMEDVSTHDFEGRDELWAMVSSMQCARLVAYATFYHTADIYQTDKLTFDELQDLILTQNKKAAER